MSSAEVQRWLVVLLGQHLIGQRNCTSSRFHSRVFWGLNWVGHPTQDRCWACSSRVWEQRMMYPNPKNKPLPPPQSFQILTLTMGGAQTCPLPWRLKRWANTKKVRPTALMLEEATVTGRCCSSLGSVTSTVSNYLSFKCSCCMMLVWYTQQRILGDFWWHIILWDLTTLFWPCGCCWGLHHRQNIYIFFV